MPIIKQYLPAIPKRSYPIIVEDDALEKIAGHVKKIGSYDKYILLYDENLFSVAKKAKKTLKKCEMIAVPCGEESKTLKQAEKITRQLLACQASRKSLIINIGGGMLTDLGGFIASLYMRGTDFVHVSTSLLGMTDAAIGGKTGVDVGTTKNILGTITHPKAILVDIDVLASLPDRMLKEGLVEVIKMAAVLDKKIFKWLEINLDAIVKRDRKMLAKCIEYAVQMKVKVVTADEREGGRRMLLNFGHTVGHAVEALSKFKISHGQAVSIGMNAEMAIAKSASYDRIIALLKKINMPLNIPENQLKEKLWEIMKNDKKSFEGKVRVSLPLKIGQGKVKTITRQDFYKLF